VRHDCATRGFRKGRADNRFLLYILALLRGTPGVGRRLGVVGPISQAGFPCGNPAFFMRGNGRVALRTGKGGDDDGDEGTGKDGGQGNV